jgi:hypothetical protein
MLHTDRYLFVGDWQSQSILVYSLERDWEFVRAIGSKGTGADQFRLPMGMCVYRDRLIVCDKKNGRLQFIDISAADAKGWKFDAPFGSAGGGEGQFGAPVDVCAASDVLFVAEYLGNRVQSFAVAASGVTGALTLTHRSFIGVKVLDSAISLVSTSDAFRVFIGASNRISEFDARDGSSAVRSFAELEWAHQLALSEGRLYAARGDALSVVDVTSGNPLALDPALDKRMWREARGIAVLGDFFCIADGEGHCVHVIPRV